MEFRKQECQGSQVLAKKVLIQSLLIYVFFKVAPLETLCTAIRRGATIFFSGRPDVQPATKLLAGDSSPLKTSQGWREIIGAANFAMRFSSPLETRKKQLPQWRGMAESFPE